MDKTIYLNFKDIRESTQEYILDKAIAEIVETEDIEKDYGYKCGTPEYEQCVREKAEQKIYEFNYVFNV